MILLSLIVISIVVVLIQCYDEQSKSDTRQLRYTKNGMYINIYDITSRLFDFNMWFIIYIGLDEDESKPDDVMISGSLISIGSSHDDSFIGMKVSKIINFTQNLIKSI